MNEPLQGRRIVVVVAWAVLGGAERIALAMARHFREQQGAQVDVLAFTDEAGRFRDAAREVGLPWHPHPLTWHGSRTSKVLSLVGLAVGLRRMRPDVVFSYTSRPNVLCGLVWRTTGASLAVWNQQDLVPPTKFSQALVSRAARMTPLLIANSQAAADYLVSYAHAPERNVRVIVEGTQRIEPLEDRAAWRARLGVDDETVVVSMLAHFHHAKDHATLLHAWPHVVAGLEASGRKALLVLAGRPSGTEDAVKALAFDLGLGSSITFAGEVSDVGGLLEATDIAVLSSPSESAPHALLESMSTGLPVAGTDIPGIREIVSGSQRRFLVPVGDSQGLAAALVTLGSDPVLRRELGEENRRHVLARAPVPAPEATAEAIAEALARRTRS